MYACLCYKNYVRAALDLKSYSIICMSIGANNLCLFSLKSVSLHIKSILAYAGAQCLMLTAGVVQN